MGTHTYLLEVFRKKKGETLPTPRSLGFHRYSSTSAGDFGSIEEVDEIPSLDETRYMEEFTCRELLLNESGIWEGTFGEPEHNYMVGIRCYGEQYSVVSELLQGNSNSKTLIAKMIKDVFGITAEIKYGKLDERLAYRAFGTFRRTYTGGEKEVLGYVTLYLSSWENIGISVIDSGVSAILALLKEPRVIAGILSGEINDKKTLCKELIKISIDRAHSKDASYQCFALIGITGTTPRTLREIQNAINYQLSSSHNDDGSDWYSMMNLAIFCYTFQSLEGRGYRIYSGDGGPSDFIMENSTPKDFQSFKEFLDEPNLLQDLRSHIVGDNHRNDDFDDDFDDDYDDDYATERKVQSWADA